MKRKTSLLVLIAAVALAALFFILWHRDLSTRPERGGSPLALETETSRVGFSAEIPLSELLALLEQNVPRRLANSGNGPDAGTITIWPFSPVTIGTKYDYVVERTGGFTATVLNPRTVRLSAPFKFSGHGGFRGTLAHLLSLDAKSFRGSLNLVVDITPSLTDDWTLDSRCAIGIEWISDPRVEIVGGKWVSFKGILEPVFERQLGSLSNQISVALNRYDLKREVQKVYRATSVPVALSASEKAFVHLTPEGIDFSGLRFEGGAVKLATAVRAKIEVSREAREEKELPLPSLTKIDPAENRIALRVPIKGRYEEFTRLLNEALGGQEFREETPAGPVALRLEGFEVYPGKEGAVIAIALRADLPGKLFDTRGRVYLVGTPEVLEGGTRIGLKEAHYTGKLDNAFWSAALALLEGPVNRKILEAARYDASRDLDEAATRLTAALEAVSVSEGLRLSLENVQVRIGRFALSPEEIALEALLDGQASIQPKS